jgi:DNA-directed RNA polymerase subunit RPC12/RpoP
MFSDGFIYVRKVIDILFRCCGCGEIFEKIGHEVNKMNICCPECRSKDVTEIQPDEEETNPDQFQQPYEEVRDDF